MSQRKGIPDQTLQDAADRLGVSIVEIRKKVYRGTLPGYAILRGQGLIKKQPGKHYQGIDTLFYREDLEEYAENAPLVEKREEPVPYTEDQKRLVLAEAEKIKEPDGSVNRARLQIEILKWNSYKYKVMAQILNDEGIPPLVNRGPTRRPARKSS